MNETSDAQFLRDYVEGGDEAAFRELVTRYTDLVYSSALRQLESPDLAADIVQTVFVDLARKAAGLSTRLGAEGSVAGWLHRATRYAALNHLRATRRRLANERQAMEQLLANADPSLDWEKVRPVLDEALDSLEDQDREAILMRYFQQCDFRTVGLALGLSDDAAQKRVSRALDQLRGHFARRQVEVGAGALAALLSTQVVHAAPPGLAAAAGAVALASTAAGAASTALATTTVAGMTLLQKVLVAAAITALAGIGTYEARQAGQLRKEVRALRERQSNRDEGIRSQPVLGDAISGGFSPGNSDRQASDRPLAAPDPSFAAQQFTGTMAGTGFSQLREQNSQLVRQMQEEQRKFLAGPGGGAVASGSGRVQSSGAGGAGASAISTRTLNGNTLVTYRGQEFSAGKTQGRIATRVSNIQGQDYAAAFDGDRVIWENVPGAAQKLKETSRRPDFQQP